MPSCWWPTSVTSHDRYSPPSIAGLFNSRPIAVHQDLLHHRATNLVSHMQSANQNHCHQATPQARSFHNLWQSTDSGGLQLRAPSHHAVTKVAIMPTAESPRSERIPTCMMAMWINVIAPPRIGIPVPLLSPQSRKYFSRHVGTIAIAVAAGYNFSVAVWSAYIALFGIAVERAWVMVVYLDGVFNGTWRSGCRL